MADDDGKTRNDPNGDGDLDRLRSLGDRLNRARTSGHSRTNRGSSGRPSDMGPALRMSTEFIAGVIAGGAIGWFLDTWLGTMPLFLIIFMGLGTAAGVVNVIRSANAISTRAAADKGKDQGGAPPTDKV